MRANPMRAARVYIILSLRSLCLPLCVGASLTNSLTSAMFRGRNVSRRSSLIKRRRRFMAVRRLANNFLHPVQAVLIHQLPLFGETPALSSLLVCSSTAEALLRAQVTLSRPWAHQRTSVYQHRSTTVITVRRRLS
jgi:hypothetical protein